MFGDLMLKIKNLWFQFWCIHNYKWIYRKDNGDSFQSCTKCQKIKQ